MLYKCPPSICGDYQVSGACVYYSGNNLSLLNINYLDNLNTIVQKINNFFISLPTQSVYVIKNQYTDIPSRFTIPANQLLSTIIVYSTANEIIEIDFNGNTLVPTFPIQANVPETVLINKFSLSGSDVVFVSTNPLGILTVIYVLIKVQ